MLDKFVMRLVQFGDTPPQINVVCKRCLGMASFNDIFSVFLWTSKQHDCSNAKINDFCGIPDKIK